MIILNVLLAHMRFRVIIIEIMMMIILGEINQTQNSIRLRTELTSIPNGEVTGRTGSNLTLDH